MASFVLLVWQLLQHFVLSIAEIHLIYSASSLNICPFENTPQQQCYCLKLNIFGKLYQTMWCMETNDCNDVSKFSCRLLPSSRLIILLTLMEESSLPNVDMYKVKSALSAHRKGMWPMLTLLSIDEHWSIHKENNSPSKKN